MNAEKHYVYRCFDAEDRLLYIGCTEYPQRRLEVEHPRNSPWFAACDYYVFEGPYSHWDGFAIERAAIESEHPIHNIRWNEAAA